MIHQTTLLMIHQKTLLAAKKSQGCPLPLQQNLVKKKLSSFVKKFGVSQRKRDPFSPPQHVTDVKHKQMTRKFEVVARKLAEFQMATTWSAPRDQVENQNVSFFWLLTMS